MLDTKELEKFITNKVTKAVPNANLDQINFCVGTDNSPEGIYLYTQNNSYHFVYTEKGQIREHKELDTLDNVLWNVLDAVLFDIAIDFAMKNKAPGKDFRRSLFSKEIELYSKFGEIFKLKKEKEIEKILAENPYIDK